MKPELGGVFHSIVRKHLAAFIGYVADFAAPLEGEAARCWQDVVEYLSQ